MTDATPAEIAFVQEAYRHAEAVDAARLTDFPLADSRLRESHLAIAADAQDLADNDLAWHDGKDEYSVEVVGAAFQIEGGDTVTLEFLDFGLAAGRDFFVARVGEDTARNVTRLTLLG